MTGTHYQSLYGNEVSKNTRGGYYREIRLGELRIGRLPMSPTQRISATSNSHRSGRAGLSWAEPEEQNVGRKRRRFMHDPHETLLPTERKACVRACRRLF